MELTTKQQSQVIRISLRKEYKSITVRKGSGTASGWIHIGYDVDRPINCNCEEGGMYCTNCKEAMNGLSNKIENEALEALKEFDSTPYTYISDDNSDHNCILVQISVKEKESLLSKVQNNDKEGIKEWENKAESGEVMRII